MPKVDWTSTYATWAAVARRRAVRRDGKTLNGINIATFLWTDGNKTYATTRWSQSPLGTGASEVKHSEEVIWGEIKAKCTTIYWVFTERAPCPPAPVGRGCSIWLPEVLKEVGVAKEKTPIYWIYEYPDDLGNHFEGSIADQFKAIIPVNKQGNLQVWKQAGKAIRDESTSGLQGVDKFISTSYGGKVKVDGVKSAPNEAKTEIRRLKDEFKKGFSGAIPDMP